MKPEYKEKAYIKDRKSLKGVPDLRKSDLDKVKLEALRKEKKSARQKERRREKKSGKYQARKKYANQKQ